MSARGIPLAVADKIARELRRRLRVGGVRPAAVIAVGSARRREARVRDLDFLVLASGAADVTLSGRGRSVLVRRTGRPTAHYNRLVLRRNGRRHHLDLFFTTEAELPFALFHYTGPRAYNVRTRAHAKRQGWRLSQYGLFLAGSQRRVPGSKNLRSERELAAFIGVTYRRPPQR